jgi:uncharacterized protein (UPF0264 family)
MRYKGVWVRLLVSVRDAREARVALAGGAAVIDVKEPSRGSLGAASISTSREIIAAVGGRAPVSVVIGDVDSVEGSARAAREHAPLGADVLKVGLAGVRSATMARHILGTLTAAARTMVLVVAYADFERAWSLDPEAILGLCPTSGIDGIVLDTHDKSRGHLLSCLTTPRLARLIESAHSCGLLVGVAGKLSESHVPLMRELGADLFGVRGAACLGTRSGALSGELVARLASVIGASGSGERRLSIA